MSLLTAKAAENVIDIDSRYTVISPIPQQPNFAARIEGVDLTQTLPERTRDELRQALLDFEVLLFPPQELTPEQHLDLASIFGPVSAGAYFPRKPGSSSIEVLENDQERPPAIDHWHTDLSWLREPPAGTVIQITEVPPVGGNTTWASMSKAFSALSPAFKQYLRSLQATHTWEVSNWRNYLENLGEDVLINSIKRFKPVSHPVVSVHPESGKELLYVNETFTRNINDVSREESQAILHFLAQWIKQPEFCYTHNWEAHGIAVWDNRSTQHYASADYWPNRRVNQRVTFASPGTWEGDTSTLDLVGGGQRQSNAAYGA